MMMSYSEGEFGDGFSLKFVMETVQSSTTQQNSTQIVYSGSGGL